MKPASFRRVKSADRTLDLLECLAASPAPMCASKLSETLGIPKSSLFHLAGTLIERGYLLSDDDHRFRLGPKVVELARGADQDTHLSHVVGPVLDELCAALNETCSFNVQIGDDVKVIESRAGRHALTYTMQTGDIAPLYAVSSGKIMLAGKDAAWFRDYMNRVRFEQFTPNTIQSHDRLLREIERARLDGFGFVDQEFTPGIVGIAAAVHVDGKAKGAINVAVPNARFDAQKGSAVRQHLRNAVARAERKLASSG